MAINKVINKSSKLHKAMKNVISYVLQDKKVLEGYVAITGPYDSLSIKPDHVYSTWTKEKKLWGKNNGRLYAHNVISFHKDEKINAEEALDFGGKFVKHFFPNHQCLITVHQDRDHIHVHIITNTVSYIDGMKLHQKKQDLQKQKDYTNDLCREQGLSVTEKGRHFDGSLIDQYEITAWNKDKYSLLTDTAKKSFVADCAIALWETVRQSASREEFVSGMAERGWSVQWEDSRKHLVFQNIEGKKVRDSNIKKTFSGLDVSKEALINEFARQNAERERQRRETNLEQYYSELVSAVRGIAAAKAVIAKSVRSNFKTSSRDTESNQHHSGQAGSDQATCLRELEIKERASRKKRSDSFTARKNRDDDLEL